MTEDLAPTPVRPWSGRDHQELADLVRELLMAGHLIDRSGMPHLIAKFGREGMAQIAIDEWMAASPIYTRRMQALLGFEGDSVPVIFKGMQFDIGAPPEFLDFRYTVHDDLHGEFELAHCGALMDVEPMGEDYVQVMCHDIEDPTFDATATATNPRAQVRPIHRPPREPANREPHCHWTVTIVADAEPLPYPPQAERLGDSRAAAVALATRPLDLPADDGDSIYSGPVDSDLMMERFSSATLAAVADEICLQQHLLSRAFLLPVADRVGEAARDIGVAQLTGIAGLAAKRLGACLGVGQDLAGVAAVLQVHPMLLPRTYVAASFTMTDQQADSDADSRTLTVTIGSCPALNEPDGLTWPALLVEHDDRALRAAVTAILPTAQIQRVEPCAEAPRDAARWQITSNPHAEPAGVPNEVILTEFSTGANFHFSRHL